MTLFAFLGVLALVILTQVCYTKLWTHMETEVSIMAPVGKVVEGFDGGGDGAWGNVGGAAGESSWCCGGCRIVEKPLIL